MQLAPINAWPLSNPPSLTDYDSSKGEAVFREAMEKWLEKALIEYLPPEVVCLVPAPLLPDSSRLHLPVPYLARAEPEHYRGIARFGVVTALFQQLKASLFLRIHEFYVESEPVIVVFRSTSTEFLPEDPTEVRVGRLCVITVACNQDEKLHPADVLAEGFGTEGEVIRIHPGEFTPFPEAREQAEVKFFPRGDRGIIEEVNLHVRVEHPDYMSILAPILPELQVVMVLARSIHDARWEARRRFGAGGVTLLLKTGTTVTEDLAVRLCAVAQRVDGLLGSLHFATEDVARAKAAADALEILNHSVGNHLKAIELRNPNAGPRLLILQRILQGAVGFARQQGMPVLDDQQALAWPQLGYQGQAFDQTLRQALWGRNPALEFFVSGLENGAVDSRALMLIEELARNLAYGPLEQPGSIRIDCDPRSGIGSIQVEGWALTSNLEALSDRLQEIQPGSDVMRLRGTAAVIQLAKALQCSRVPVAYVLGEEAIARHRQGLPPDLSKPDLGFELWRNSPASESRESDERPFLMLFQQIQIQLQ